MINPYSLFSFSYILVILLYELKWSDSFTNLGIVFSIFVFINIMFFTIFSILYTKIGFKPKKEIHFKYSPKYKYFVFVIVLGCLIDGYFSGGFPIFGNVAYTEYGVKIFHPVLQFVTVLFSYILFETFLEEKSHKITLISMYIIILIPFVLAVSRGMLIMTLVTAFFIFIQKRRFRLKHFFLVFVVGIAGIVVFGVVGNLRLNQQVGQHTSVSSAMDSSLILQIGDSSNSFAGSKIPKTFFWTYLYTVSPLANLKTTINNNSNLNSNGIVEFAITQWMPDYFSSRIYPQYKSEISSNAPNTRINSNLTASTVYQGSFLLFGWTGMLLTFIFILVFPLVYLWVLNRACPRFYSVGFAILCTIYLLLVFNNMFTFSGLSLQLLLPFVGELLTHKNV